MIKYHDNIHGRQYGDDHMLTNNWNAEEDFPEESYIRVYFRLNCPAYNDRFAYGFEDKKDYDAFHQEMSAILYDFNISEGTGGRFENFPMEHLYIHPQDLSGVVAKWKVKGIAEVLATSETVTLRWVDLYEDISPISNEDFIKILENKREQIAEDLLLAFKTKRSNLYVVVSDHYNPPVERIARQCSIRRREAENPYEDTVSFNYVLSIFNELVEAGRIVSAETRKGRGYRTAKEKELKSAA